MGPFRVIPLNPGRAVLPAGGLRPPDRLRDRRRFVDLRIRQGQSRRGLRARRRAGPDRRARPSWRCTPPTRPAAAPSASPGTGNATSPGRHGRSAGSSSRRSVAGRGSGLSRRPRRAQPRLVLGNCSTMRWPSIAYARTCPDWAVVAARVMVIAGVTGGLARGSHGEPSPQPAVGAGAKTASGAGSKKPVICVSRLSAPKHT